MYTFHSKVRYSEVDESGRLAPHSIVNYFQDCSTFQSEELGVGVSALQNLHHAWLLNSWQIVLVNPPALCEEIDISTWAYEFKGFYGYRNFLMQNADKQPLAYANSIWIYVDTQTGHPSRFTNDSANPYPLEPAYPMEYAPRKIAFPDNQIVLPEFVVPASYSDTNHHINNGAYIRMACDLLPSGFSYRQIRAEYRNAVYAGDCLTPSRCMTEQTCTIVLTAENGQPACIIEFS